MSVRLRHKLGGYREYAVAPDLADVCEASWTYRTPRDAPLPGSVAHRLLPDPSLSLAYCCRRDAAGRPLEPRLILIGPITGPRLIDFPPGHEIAAIKVKLEWVRPLLRAAPPEHRDAQDALSGVLPRVARPLEDQLFETRTQERALALLAAALGEQRRRGPGRESEAAGRALDLVRGTAGGITVERIAHLEGLSPRHLRRLVREAAGISLKEYARQTRLLHAITTADARRRPAWADIAAEAGFYDQSHLVRDCQALCGLSPGRLARERHAEDEVAAGLSNPS